MGQCNKDPLKIVVAHVICLPFVKGKVDHIYMYLKKNDFAWEEKPLQILDVEGVGGGLLKKFQVCRKFHACKFFMVY